jgi:hypothetical protein
MASIKAGVGACFVAKATHIWTINHRNERITGPLLIQSITQSRIIHAKIIFS